MPTYCYSLLTDIVWHNKLNHSFNGHLPMKATYPNWMHRQWSVKACAHEIQCATRICNGSHVLYNVHKANGFCLQESRFSSPLLRPKTLSFIQAHGYFFTHTEAPRAIWNGRLDAWCMAVFWKLVHGQNWSYFFASQLNAKFVKASWWLFVNLTSYHQHIIMWFPGTGQGESSVLHQ